MIEKHEMLREIRLEFIQHCRWLEMAEACLAGFDTRSIGTFTKSFALKASLSWSVRWYSHSLCAKDFSFKSPRLECFTWRKNIWLLDLVCESASPLSKMSESGGRFTFALKLTYSEMLWWYSWRISGQNCNVHMRFYFFLPSRGSTAYQR
jgi:hypothetical protein